MNTLLSILAFILLLLTVPGTIELFLVTLGSWLPSKHSKGNTFAKKPVIVIPAHNEAQVIGHNLDNIRAHLDSCPIVLIADNCTDKTAEIAAGKGVRVLERNDTSKFGKSYALDFAFNTLLKEDYDGFIVLDADTIVSPDITQVILQSGHEAVQVFHGIDPSLTSWRQQLMRIAFYAFNFVRPKGRHNLSFSCGIFGNGFYLHRNVLERVSYHAESLTEDVYYHLLLIQNGIKVHFLPDAEALSMTPSSGSGVASQRIRWEGGRLNLAKKEAWPLLQQVLKGKWENLEPLFDLLTFPLSYHVLMILIVFPFFPWIAGISFLIALWHISTGIIQKGKMTDFLILLVAPFYALWKLTTLPFLNSQKEWVRTDRSTTKRDDNG